MCNYPESDTESLFSRVIELPNNEAKFEVV